MSLYKLVKMRIYAKKFQMKYLFRVSRPLNFSSDNDINKLKELTMHFCKYFTKTMFKR